MQSQRALELLGVSILAASAAWGQTAPYLYLDNVEGEWVSTNAVPIRPMALTADEAALYAVHTEANVVVEISGTGRGASPRRAPPCRSRCGTTTR